MNTRQECPVRHRSARGGHCLDQEGHTGPHWAFEIGGVGYKFQWPNQERGPLTPGQEAAASVALRAAADALENLPPQLKHQTVALLRMYADHLWRLGPEIERQLS